MKSSNIIFYLLSHFVATCVNFGLLLGTLVVLTVIVYVFDSDPPGGQGFVLPMLMFCVLYTIFFCAAVIFISVAFQIVYHWKKYPKNPIVSGGDKSSGILVHDGTQYRLYTMHPNVWVFFPRSAKTEK